MRKGLGALAVVLAGALGVILIPRLRSRPGREPAGMPPSAVVVTQRVLPLAETATPALLAQAPPQDVSATEAGPNRPGATIGQVNVPPRTPVETPLINGIPPATVIENMRTTFRHYASVCGANPIGTNEEITRALRGDNPRKLNFLKEEDGNRVNEKGELIDPWGTPYFFHQLSGTLMEVHSAGPDRIMWTADDIVIQ
jgi:hypothetical protein